MNYEFSVEVRREVTVGCAHHLGLDKLSKKDGDDHKIVRMSLRWRDDRGHEYEVTEWDERDLYAQAVRVVRAFCSRSPVVRNFPRTTSPVKRETRANAGFASLWSLPGWTCDFSIGCSLRSVKSFLRPQWKIWSCFAPTRISNWLSSTYLATFSIIWTRIRFLSSNWLPCHA